MKLQGATPTFFFLVVAAVLLSMAAEQYTEAVPQPQLHHFLKILNNPGEVTNISTPAMASVSASRNTTARAHSINKKKHKKSSHTGSIDICGNITQPEPVSCSFLNKRKFYNINITGSSPCKFSCIYDPSQMSPLRLEVHLKYKHPVASPSFISVQQQFYITSWTLPIIFPELGENQKFTSMETLLCPPDGVKEETVDFTIASRGPDSKELQIALHNVSFTLQKEVNVTVKVTPVSLWYKRYQWAPSEESVLVIANSDRDSDVCGLLVLQNAKCPVSSKVSGLIEHGRYQTFTSQAGMVARRSHFPDGFYVIIISLPDDDACILNPYELSHNRTDRSKSVVLEVYNHATIGSTWYIFVLSAGFLVTLAIAAAMVITALIKRNLMISGEEDEVSLLNNAHGSRTCRVEAGVGVALNHGQNTEQNYSHRPTAPQGVGNIYHGEEEEEAGGGSDGGRLALEDSSGEADLGHAPLISGIQPIAALPPPEALPPTTYAPQGDVLRMDRTFNPLYVWWWKSVAVHESHTAQAQVAEVGFQNSLIIMGVFAALPISELLRSYLSMVLHHGQEDLCFWNSRCLTAFGLLPDFTRIFTNLGYILLGIAYVFIVKRHRKLTTAILKGQSAKDSVGVSHQYGLFTTLGYSLVLQGLMSALYHTCPNSVTIKFDMMFMYVMMVVSVVVVWGLRHGDVTHHVYPTVITVGLTLMFAETRMWVSSGFFWGVFSTIYGIILISNAIFMSFYDIWSFSPSQLLQAWKGWREVKRKLRDVLGEQDTTSRPIQVVRLMVGVGSNLALIVIGIIIDPNFYYFILIVCLVNMGLYFANYVVAKRLAFKEKGTSLGWTCLGLSCVLWIIALTFFFQKQTDSENSPAASRAKNSACFFLSVFDKHDIWHITSSFALFFFFVALLTMDDDKFSTPAQNMRVF